MPTTTTTASSELAKLQTVRDKAHAEFQERKAKVEAWDTEGLAPEVRPGTAQADVHAIRREQDHGPNPHRDECEAVRASYLKLDAALQAFKRESAADRIAEVTEALDSEDIREAWERLRAELDRERKAQEEVRSICVDCPGIDGQALGYDPRVDEWYRQAEDALRGLDERELVKPGLTPAAVVKLDG